MPQPTFTLWPAIDCLDGQVVRLTEGVYGSEKVYATDPVQTAHNFAKQGLTHLHFIDLNGAKDGDNPHFKLVQEICSTTNLSVQVGGGIRTLETAEKYFQAGVDRLIIGSAGFENPDFLDDLLTQFSPRKIVLGLDVRLVADDFVVFTHGWQKRTDITALDFLQTTKAVNILMTDIAKDGKLQGPNTAMYQKFAEKFPTKNFIASGGITRLGDISAVKNAGCGEVIVGKALYEGRISVEELTQITLSNASL